MASSNKNPVSALQELMAAKKLPLPTYFEEDACGKFKCTASAGGVTAVGFGPNKKVAKQESAKNILEKLRVASVVVKLQETQKTVRNYIGELNEYASQKGITYPEYYPKPSTPGIEEFVCTCSFWGRRVYGKGQNKKDAKQDSAKNMLELIYAENVPREVIRVTVPNENLGELTSVFNSLTLRSLAQQSSPSSSSVTEVRIVGQSEVEVLSAKLRAQGVDFTITEVQSNPYVLYLKIKNDECCLVESGEIGDSRDKTLKKLLEKALLLRNKGCLLKSDLITL